MVTGNVLLRQHNVPMVIGFVVLRQQNVPMITGFVVLRQLNVSMVTSLCCPVEFKYFTDLVKYSDPPSQRPRAL